MSSESAATSARPLEGRAALVTGAGKRVGRAIVLELARLGADVAVHFNRSADEAETTAELARHLGAVAMTVQAELSDEQAIDRMFDAVLTRFPHFGVLVNCAAVFYPQTVEETDGRAWDAVLDVNLRATWLCARRAAMHMRRAGAGKIVNIGCAVGSWHAWPRYPAYSVSKIGVRMVTEWLALELAPAIQVNGVAPGTVLFHEGASEELKERVRARIPAGVEGTPEDVARAVAFLVTGPDYVTGQTLAVDGGRAVG